MATRDLLFQGGYIGPDLPRDQSAGCCPDMRNLILTPDGSSLRPMPGFERCYPYRLLQGDAYLNHATGLEEYWESPPIGGTYEALPAGLRVVAVAGAALGDAGGRLIAVVDESNGRIVAMGWHPGGALLDPELVVGDRLPIPLWRLKRSGPHDYPTVLNYGGLTRVATAHDEPWCWDGGLARRLGVRAPQAAPRVEVGRSWQNTSDIEGDIAERETYFRIFYGGANPDARVAVTDSHKVVLTLFNAETGAHVSDPTVNGGRTIKLKSDAPRYVELQRIVNAGTGWESELLAGRNAISLGAPAVGTAGNALWFGPSSSAKTYLTGGKDAATAIARVTFNTEADYAFDGVDSPAAKAYAYLNFDDDTVFQSGYGYYSSVDVRFSINNKEIRPGQIYGTTKSACWSALLQASATQITAKVQGVTASVIGAQVKVEADTTGPAGNATTFRTETWWQTYFTHVNGSKYEGTFYGGQDDQSVAVGESILIGVGAGLFCLCSKDVDAPTGYTKVPNDNGTGTGSLANAIAALTAAINTAAVGVTATGETSSVLLTADTAGAAGESIALSVSPYGSKKLILTPPSTLKIPDGADGDGERAVGLLTPAAWGATANESEILVNGDGQPENGDEVVIGNATTIETYAFYETTPAGAGDIDVEIGADLDETIANLEAAIAASSTLLSNDLPIFATSVGVVDLPLVALSSPDSQAAHANPGNDGAHAGLAFTRWSYERLWALTGREVWAAPTGRPESIQVSPGLWDQNEYGTPAGTLDGTKSDEPTGSIGYAHIWLREDLQWPTTQDYIDLGWDKQAGTVPGSTDEKERQLVTVSAQIAVRGVYPTFDDFNLALVFDKKTDFSDIEANRVVVQIPPSADAALRATGIVAGAWQSVNGVMKDLLIHDDALGSLTTAEGFAYQSIGLRLLKKPREGLASANNGLEPQGDGVLPQRGSVRDKWAELSVDAVYFQPANAVDVAAYEDAAEGTFVKQTFTFSVAFVDSSNGLESAPSPETWPIDILPSQAIAIDVTGIGANWPHDMENGPDDAERIDKVAVYASYLDWALTDEGLAQYHLVWEYDLPEADGDDRTRRIQLRTSNSDFDLTLLTNTRAPFLTNYAMPSAAYVLVDKERVIVAGQPDYSVGRCKFGTSAEHGETVFERLWAFENPDGDLAYYDEAVLNDAGLPATAYVLRRADLTPQWGPHLEGRTIRVNALKNGKMTTQRGLIKKALRWEPDATKGQVWDRTYDRLWVEGIDPSSASSACTYTIEGYGRRVWWSLKSGAYGTTQEFGALWNYLDLDMPGDEIVGLGKVGDFVVVLGRKYTHYMLQDAGALDDTAASGLAFPRPRRFEVGCLGGRTFVEVPGGALWVTPNGVLVHATPDGIREHETAVRFAGWLGSEERVDAAMLAHAHGEWDAKTGQYWLYVAGAAGGEYGRWSDQAEQDGHVGWSDAEPPVAVDIPFWEQ